MANQDILSPIALSRNLEVTEITDRSLSIKWDKVKDDKTAVENIRYVVGLTEAENPSDPWHIACEAKDICEFTFTKLKASTLYAFYVMAFDEAGNCAQYPCMDGSMSAMTKEAVKDIHAPSVLSKDIEVTDVMEDSISIRWVKAKDDITLAKEIRYVVGLTEAENPEDPWHIVREEKDISEHTFKQLKGDTLYAFYVMAYDEEGNMTQYPLYNGSMTARTLTPDIQAPTVISKDLDVIKVTDRSITIKWMKATDNRTKDKDILYIVGLTEAENPADPWHIVREEKNISQHTFTKLKPITKYSFYVIAKDNAGNCTQYPCIDGSMSATTLEQKEDILAPTAISKNLDVTEITNRTISIKWEKAQDDITRAKDIRYVVGLTEANNPRDPWHIVREEKDICAHTFKDLNPGTTYAFYVMAYDEAGNFCQYPLYNGSMSATTQFGDGQAPVAPNKELVIKNVTETSISIQWERAKDDMTAAKDIRYVIGLTETDDSSDPWHIVGENTNICKFTFKNLKPSTHYSFFVMAYDEAGNMTQYPGLDRSETTMTLMPVEKEA